MKKTIFFALALTFFLMPIAAGARFNGCVTCDGSGVAGVVVTDGTDCTTTDANGCFSLPGSRDARYVYITTPAGYLTEREHGTIPRFYLPVDKSTPDRSYNFRLKRNPLNDTKHTMIVQADPQITSPDDIKQYKVFLNDMNQDLEKYRGKRDVTALDCGDIVGDSPWMFPATIEAQSIIDIPIYRVIGNHDMTYGGRSYETSYSKYEELFGPIYYSFNKGKAHYIVINNNFYVNRDYQYIGYIDERTFAWMEQDLSYVPDDHLVFVIAHIPFSSSEELKWNTLQQDETSNARGLFEMLQGRNAHLLTGHSHFNHNVCFNDSLMEHNTAAVCGIWWKADVCVDGTPIGYGVYDIDSNNVKWRYKSSFKPADYQATVYTAGSSPEFPEDIIANVWNYDKQWKVEWLENGKVMGEMTQFEGYDPEARAICADKKRVVYDWIYPVKTAHLFRATPVNSSANITVRVTDRFGNTYTATPRSLFYPSEKQ